jgi:hypothetical protein
MKYFKYIFLLLMLFAQQVFALSCTDAQVKCETDRQQYITWGHSPAACQCKPLDQLNFTCGYDLTLKDGRYYPMTGGTNCTCQSPYARVGDACVIQCPDNQVRNAAGDGCTFPPHPPSPINTPSPTSSKCPGGQYEVPRTGNCEVPVVCPNGLTRNVTANTCGTGNATSSNAANACNAALDICNAAKSKSGIQGVACILHTSPKHGASTCMVGTTSNRMTCTTCSGGDSYPVDVKTGEDIVEGTAGGSGNPPTGSGSDSDAPKTESDCKSQGGTWAARPGVTTQYGSPVYSCTDYTNFPQLRTECELDGGTWVEPTKTSGRCEFKFPELKADCEEDGGTWKEVFDGKGTTTGSCHGHKSDQNSNPDQNPNCGGETGISCESTQLKLLDSLGNINKNLTDTLKLPTDAIDCSVGTQCYKDKEKSLLDSIKEKTGNIPTNILNMKDLIMGSYLEPFAKDKTSGTCNANSFEPITLSFTSIDGKVASYIQPLPGDFLCRLFAIVRIFLVTGAIIAGLKMIIFGFIKAT